MKTLIFIIIGLFSVSCSTRKTPPAKPRVEMEAKDVVDVLKLRMHEFKDKEIYNSSDEILLLKMTKAEYDVFADGFLSDLKKLGKSKFSYDFTDRSVTEFDDDLAYFSLSLGTTQSIEPTKYYDIIISGSYDPTNERILIRINKTHD